MVEKAPGSPDVRASLRAVVEPLARGLAALGLTPNALTVIGFVLAIVAALAAAGGLWLVAAALVIIGGLFDVFDGAVARATGRATRFGAFLDSTLDRWGEGVIYVGIISGLAALADLPLGPVVAGAAMASAFMVSYTRAKSEGVALAPVSGMASVGLAPREIRIVILALGLAAAGLLPVNGAAGASLPGGWLALVGALLLIALLASITTIQRILAVRRQALAEDTR
jgi:CDP-diacylglycerol--glycerol-3-phosphate 3-phosphatidyltransferase